MKVKKSLTVFLCTITAVLVITSGLLKAVHFQWSVQGLNKYNLPDSATAAGIMEISFCVLFLLPKTLRIGFILLCCYYCGAMGVELSHDGDISHPAVPLIIIWITAFLRDSSIFFKKQEYC